MILIWIHSIFRASSPSASAELLHNSDFGSREHNALVKRLARRSTCNRTLSFGNTVYPHLDFGWAHSLADAQPGFALAENRRSCSAPLKAG
jgi:hypothetical protein